VLVDYSWLNRGWVVIRFRGIPCMSLFCFLRSVFGLPQGFPGLQDHGLCSAVWCRLSRCKLSLLILRIFRFLAGSMGLVA
jgi:hypothetical protein